MGLVTTRARNVEMRLDEQVGWKPRLVDLDEKISGMRNAVAAEIGTRTQQ